MHACTSVWILMALHGFSASEDEEPSCSIQSFKPREGRLYGLSCFTCCQEFCYDNFCHARALNIFLFFSESVHFFGSGVLWMQKLRSPLQRTQSCQRFFLLALTWVGQNIACMLCLLLGSVSYHWSLHFPHIRVLPTQKVSTATPLENSLLSKVLSFKPWVGQKSSVVPQGSRSKGINDD